MPRQPGKKIRQERFVVDGVLILVDLRLAGYDDGRFYGEVDSTVFEFKTLDEWRDAITKHLETTRRLTWKPYIRVHFEERHSRFDNYQGKENREEVTIGFELVWVSDQAAPITVTTHYTRRETHRREARGEVDKKTGEPMPLDEHERGRAGWLDAADVRRLIPFTSDRWHKLTAIAAAIRDVRGRIADVVGDKTGLQLDGLTNTPLLGPVAEPPGPKAKARKR